MLSYPFTKVIHYKRYDFPISPAHATFRINMICFCNSFCLQILHSGAASININKSLWKIYFDDLLPLFVASGDDGNYAQTAASDLSLLQVKFSLKKTFLEWLI